MTFVLGKFSVKLVYLYLSLLNVCNIVQYSSFALVTGLKKIQGVSVFYSNQVSNSVIEIDFIYNFLHY